MDKHYPQYLLQIFVIPAQLLLFLELDLGVGLAPEPVEERLQIVPRQKLIMVETHVNVRIILLSAEAILVLAEFVMVVIAIIPLALRTALALPTLQSD